ncbi:MAG: phosphoribosyl-ATP pyrophosphatase, partial [Caldilineaceae bacterium SB0662_bin_25]|nr:phosphoribosyl-ATP pyrophosphatase [Caldilineaceae bacterium SB0662_bin_25]
RRVSEEMADLVYHLLVLAADREIRPSEIIAVLEKRFSS